MRSFYCVWTYTWPPVFFLLIVWYLSICFREPISFVVLSQMVQCKAIILKEVQSLGNSSVLEWFLCCSSCKRATPLEQCSMTYTKCKCVAMLNSLLRLSIRLVVPCKWAFEINPWLRKRWRMCFLPECIEVGNCLEKRIDIFCQKDKHKTGSYFLCCIKISRH